jgi:hypothetical protein
MAHRITILINQEPKHFEKNVLTPDDIRQAVGLPQDYEVWLIVRSADPEGQLPKDDVQVTAPVEIKNGQRYRVVPPGTFGAVKLPAQLMTEVEVMKTEGHSLALHEEGGTALVVLENYPVPQGYNKPTTQLLLKVPLSYPNGQPDMFWTDDDFALANGSAPQSAEVFETYLGKRWRRFSWHPQGWNPATCNLKTYVEFVNVRLGKVA